MIFRKIIEVKERIRRIEEENKKMENKIIEARQEIAWLKTITSMNRYNNADGILNMTSRKLDEIEEILEK